jgi:hypothetical protein
MVVMYATCLDSLTLLHFITIINNQLHDFLHMTVRLPFGFRLRFLGTLNPPSSKLALSGAIALGRTKELVDSNSFLANCES